jgi:hypothetical protein
MARLLNEVPFYPFFTVESAMHWFHRARAGAGCGRIVMGMVRIAAY